MSGFVFTPTEECFFDVYFDSVAPHALFSSDEIPSNAHCSIRIDIVEACRSRHMNLLCFQFDPHFCQIV